MNDEDTRDLTDRVDEILASVGSSTDPITEAIDQLRELTNEHDTEVVHVIADEILCLLLTRISALGKLVDVVAKFHDLPKWYA